MANPMVGSVTAELLLNTEKFNSSIKQVQNQVRDLNTSFRGTSAKEMAEDITRLEEQLAKCSDVIKQQEEVIEQLKAGYNSIDKELLKVAENSAKASAENEKLLKSEEQVASASEKTASSLKKINLEYANLGKTKGNDFGTQLTSYMNKLLNLMNFDKSGLRADSSRVIKDWNLGTVTNEVQKAREQVELLKNSFTTFKAVMGDFGGMYEWVTMLNEWSVTSGKVTSGMSAFAQSNEQTRASLQQTHDALVNVEASFKRFDEIIKVGQESLQRFGVTSPNLESFKANMNSVYELMANFGTVYETGINESRRWSEAINQSAVSLQDYYKNIEQVTLASNQYMQKQQQMVASQQEYTSVINNASGQMTRQKEIMAQFNATYPSANAELTKFAEAQARLGNSLTSTNPKFSERIGYLQRLKAEEEQTSASTNKLGNSFTQASSKMGAMSSATSKLQGALSSTKMILSTLSSMFIWTFGMSLYEATKQTVSSKNEMESYLHQMGLGRGSINLFNKGLDETAEKFKKLNKYMIGETIAGIGMEFDLTANQMKKSMDVVAMIQNEYVRAGRKEEEATLAVKDILQGEFLRLSRETGVGKNELEATGLWSGDLKDIEGLMEALRKVGTDRHWDLFASKCNSLNDVVSETRNRISEFGASLVDQFSPAIINGFNLIIDVIDKVTSTWNNFNPMEKIAVGLPTVFAFGTALMMVAGKMNLLDLAQMGYTRGLVTTVLQLDVATVKEYGLATAITSKVTAMETSTVAEMGNATAIASRLLGLEAEAVAEYGLGGALGFSATMKGTDTVATNVNALSKDLNASSTLMNAQVVGEFTVVEGLATTSLTTNTTATELNTIIKELNARSNLSAFKAIVVYITGLKAEEVQAMSTNEALLALLGTMTALEAIVLAAVIVGIAVALGSLWMEAERAKKAIDGFYDIVDNGDDYVEDAKKNIEGLGQQYENLGNKIAEAKAKGEDTWQMEQTQARVKSNKEFAEAQLKDLEDVNQKAKKSAEEYQNSITNANYDFEKRNAKIFENLGHDTTKAGEYANQYAQQYEEGVKQMEKATNAYTSALDTGASHMEGQVDVLKNMGANQETLTQYTKEYGEEVLKNAEYQKEWAEGDFWAIFKIGLSDLKLAWIDFTYWIGQQDWWHDMTNAFNEFKNALTGEDVQNAIKDVSNAFGEFYNAIKPALPVLWEIVKALGSALWIQFVNICHGIYQAGQLLYLLFTNLYQRIKWVYPVFKAWAELKYNEIKTLIDLLGQLSSWVDQHGGKVKEWFEQFSQKDDMGKAQDIVQGLLSIGGVGGFMGTLESGFGGLGSLFKISELLGSHEDVLADITNWANNLNLGQMIMDCIQSSLSNGAAIYNEGSGEEGGATGGGFIDQLLQSWLGGDPLTTVSTAVNTYIVQPFVQGIQMGLASIPIVGDILAFLGLIDTTTPIASEKGGNIGRAIGDGIHNMILNIPIVGDILRILEMISGTNPTANSQGYGVGSNIKSGVDSGKAGTAQLVSNEMGEVISAVANAIGQAWSTAQQVGQAILNGINSVIEHHSPGIPAQLIGAEMMEIQLAMANSVDTIYQQAQEVGNAITTGIQPNTNVEFDAEAMAQYQADMMMAMGMASETVDGSESAFSQLDTTTTTTFANIGNTVGTTMLNIANTTRLNYNNIALTTRTQLTNMQSQTTRNIGAIRQSWTGMQVALIASAEHIRSETGAKINSLQNNMASFWRKVQNPALLLGAGDSSEEHGGARHRRYTSNTSGVRKLLSPNGFAGSPHINRSNSNPRGARTGTGISDKIKNKSYQGINIFDALEQYLECKENGGNCFAGGWDFNWSDDIKQALLTWHTNFGEIYDPYLYVGKFENDDFPVRGVAPIAKNYIYDAISRTSYEYYFDSKYGSPLEAWNAGHFNCYDGALLVLALANAFGFSGYMKSGSWSGIPHVWAYVEGLGDIDATAIQGGYGFTSPKVAGHPTLDKRFKHNRSSDENKGNSYTYGDIHIHIDGTGKDTEEIGQEVRNVMVDLMSPNPATGI